jgi:cellulose synthase/poly-beta-1,6-N-acetylglucosamine synthase-like glycosyltransferase
MKSLPRWYEDIMAQTRQPDEIIIVDSESSDGTTEFLRDWEQKDKKLKVIVQKCSPARGHNIGNELAMNDYIVSTDMGVRLDKKWFEEITKPVEKDPAVEVVAGSYSVDVSTVKTPAARAEYYLEGDGKPQLTYGFIIGNRSVVYKKTVWSELGGLPEDLTRYADDSVFGRQIIKAGYKMAFAPNAIVYWARPARLKEFWKEQFGYGRGDGEAAIKTPVAFRLYNKGYFPRFLVPLLTGLRRLTRPVTFHGLYKAICKRDFIAFLYIPLLEFGNGFSFGKGYVIGDKWGQVHCKQCRTRLKVS